MNDTAARPAAVQVLPTEDQSRLPAPAKPEGFNLIPHNLSEAQQLSELMAASEIVPKAYQNKPANIFVAVQMGLELGFSPMQSLRFIAVVNGMPSVYGDGLIALCRRHRDWEWIKEEFDPEAMVATCTVKRRGEPERTQTFSWSDAERAGLPKQNEVVWSRYPQRMLQMRARSWALRDTFADAIAGLAVAEEAMDYPPVDYATAPAADATAKPQAPARGMGALEARVSAAEKPQAPPTGLDQLPDDELAQVLIDKVRACRDPDALEEVGQQIAQHADRPEMLKLVRPVYRDVLEELLSDVPLDGHTDAGTTAAPPDPDEGHPGG